MDHDLFLSYCRADRQLAEQFVRAATARGVRVWFDEEIEGGQDWREMIVTALGSAKALVILFSEHSNGSSQLIKELAVADSLHKRVIPVLVSDCEPAGAYLYELASRNWISIHPLPETRLDPLVEHLMAQLGIGVAVLSAGSVPSTPAVAVREAASPARTPEQTPAHAAQGPWFPLGRYDLYILIPILVGGFLGGIFVTGETKDAGFGFSVIAACIYTLVISWRNARLNRSIFSRESFASYVVVLVVGMSPVLASQATVGESVTVFIGLVFIALVIAVFANVFQVVLRKTFQQSLFRSKIVRPLGT